MCSSHALLLCTEARGDAFCSCPVDKSVSQAGGHRSYRPVLYRVPDYAFLKHRFDGLASVAGGACLLSCAGFKNFGTDAQLVNVTRWTGFQSLNGRYSKSSMGRQPPTMLGLSCHCFANPSTLHERTEMYRMQGSLGRTCLRGRADGGPLTRVAL